MAEEVSPALSGCGCESPCLAKMSKLFIVRQEGEAKNERDRDASSAIVPRRD